jgi:hypothetical protein
MLPLHSLGAPRDIVARIESAEDQRAFFLGELSLPWVMLDISRAATLCNRGLTAERFFPGGRVVTTSTIQDSLLARFHFDRELDVVRRFQPAWHVPCDRPVYHEDSGAGRRGLIDDLVRSTLAFKDAIDGTGIGVIPLVKGVEPTEWLRCYRPLAEAGITHYACYVKQFFGGGQGRRVVQMINHVRGVVSTCGMPYLMLIGFQSLNRLPELPPEVKALAGQKWRGQSRLGQVPFATAKETYASWIADGRRLGRSRQEVLPQAQTDGTGEGG